MYLLRLLKIFISTDDYNDNSYNKNKRERERERERETLSKLICYEN